MQCSKKKLLDHFVGAREYCFWDGNAEHFGGLEIDNKIEFGRPLDRDIARLRATQNLVDQLSVASIQIADIVRMRSVLLLRHYLEKKA